MSEDKELLQLEDEWKSRLDRFTSPEPTREQTISLIEKIKAVDIASKPTDVRVQLESMQSSQSPKEKMIDLLLSQWTFHGMRSWLLTGIIMLILTVTISQNYSDMAGFITWIKWITLVMIAVMGYAFRSKNEGNAIIEKLSYYPLIQQMFARFVIVMSLQLVLALPLIFFILGTSSTIGYLFGTFTPIFFFGVVGFVSTIWFGQKIGIFITLSIWFGQIFSDMRYKSLSLFQMPENEHFALLNMVILAVSLLMLSTILLKNRYIRGEK